MKNARFLIAMTAALFVVSLRAEVKVGGVFPDFKDFKIDGTVPDNLKGRVIMIDFWASWCGPCAESFPAMEALHKKYSGRGLTIIAVNVDENKADMERFLKNHKVSFAVVRDAKQQLVEKADIGSMPASFIIGVDGKVKFTHSGYHGDETKKEYEKEIESLLGK